MRRRTIQTVVALALVAFGWVVGRANTPAPEFTLLLRLQPDARRLSVCADALCREVATRAIPITSHQRTIGSSARADRFSSAMRPSMAG
jgi:hypothetical protein